MADGSDPGRRPWNDTDNEYLARRYPTACQEGRLPDLATWMHRSVEALQAQAGRLGITAARRRWTEDMYVLLDQRFAATYAAGELAALAEQLGRSVGAVMEKAHIRGLVPKGQAQARVHFGVHPRQHRPTRPSVPPEPAPAVATLSGRERAYVERVTGTQGQAALDQYLRYAGWDEGRQQSMATRMARLRRRALVN